MLKHIKRHYPLYILGIAILIAAIIYPDLTITFSGGFAWAILYGLLFFAGFLVATLFEKLSLLLMKLWNKHHK